jgi:hypothetical protein
VRWLAGQEGPGGCTAKGPERRLPVTPAGRPSTGAHPVLLSLTRTGDMAADLAADADQWARVRPGELDWFAGTNVLGISFDPGNAPPLVPDPSKGRAKGGGSPGLRRTTWRVTERGLRRRRGAGRAK